MNLISWAAKTLIKYDKLLYIGGTAEAAEYFRKGWTINDLGIDNIINTRN